MNLQTGQRPGHGEIVLLCEHIEDLDTEPTFARPTPVGYAFDYGDKILIAHWFLCCPECAGRNEPLLTKEWIEWEEPTVH